MIFKTAYAYSPIVLTTYTVVEPHTVMVKLINTFVTCTAMLCF